MGRPDAATRPGPIGLIGATLAVGLGVVPALGGHAPVHWSEWLTAALSAAAGWALLETRGLSSTPMRLSFHQRILLILICLGALPTALAILGWGWTIRSTSPALGPRQALEEVGATGRTLLRNARYDPAHPVERDALNAHATTLNSAIGRFQRAEAFGRYYYAGLALAVLLVGAAFLYASVRLGGHLSRQLSGPSTS